MKLARVNAFVKSLQKKDACKTKRGYPPYQLEKKLVQNPTRALGQGGLLMRQATSQKNTRTTKLLVRCVVFGAVMLTVAACGTAQDGTSGSTSSTNQIIGSNNLQVVESVKGTAMYTKSRAVAFAILGSSGCTATRVAKDLFLTNHHCWNGSMCANTTFTMGYERDLPKSQQKTFACSQVVSVSKELDYALYRVRYTTTDRASDTYPIATLSRVPKERGMQLFVTGFPAGYSYKRIDASVNCKLKELAGDRYENFVAHSCDTVEGSSGSPVFDRATGDVVALHWGHMSDRENRATDIVKVLNHIKANAPTAYGQLNVRY